MAEASILVDQDQYNCAVCLDPLKEPVTISCHHSFCKVCINGFWDREDMKGIYSCPQCRETFTPRPVLHRNNMLAEMVEKVKKSELQAASLAHYYAGPGDVECDSCTRRKRKAVNSCLVCQASYCEDHLQPHYQSPAFKKHKLVEACAELQEKICSQHDKPLEIYCRTDRSFICYLKVMTQFQLKQKELKNSSFMTHQEHKGHNMVSTKSERTGKQSFPSLCVSPGCEDSPSFTVNQHLSFDGVRKSLSDMKTRVEEICEEEFNKIQPQAAAVQILPSQPQNKEDFMQYFCYLTLDPNTAHRHLILSQKNRSVTRSEKRQQYSDHPERFSNWEQVLCKESVCGRCYWEVEWTGVVSISVAYKEISRKGKDDILFGCDSQSWSLECFPSHVCFCHNKSKTILQGPVSSRIGVYVDHSSGTLSFYSISETMRLLHTQCTTFTQPLYAGFRICRESTLRICDSQ